MRCNINNNSNFDISEIEDLIQDLFSFSQERHGFKKPVTLNLMSDENNTSPLGKTAHYDPSTMEIVVYVDGRHPKDIMRSFSHELVHHHQNENGMFNNVGGESGDGYAQSNPHLRKMEKEAYLKGNMCFRDWEDGYKSSNPNILNERRIYKMSTKDWKDKELNGLLNERWGFSMDLSKLNEGNCGSHKRDDEKKCPKCKGKGCPHCATKNEEKKKMVKDPKTGKMVPDYAIDGKGAKDLKEEEVNEIQFRSGMGGGGNTSPEESERDMENARKNLKHVGNPPFKKGKKEKKMNEAEESTKKQLQQTVGDFEGEDLKKLEAFINSLKRKKTPPPKSGGNSGSGAPAQPSMQERKLREAIRRIIRKQLSRKK